MLKIGRGYMEEQDKVVVLITTGTEEEANKIASVLLNQRKAACVNIASRINSLFWWQDKLDSAEESLLIIKTKASQLDEIVRLVKELHSYEVPEIIALPIIGGSQDYLEWIDGEVQ